MEWSELYKSDKMPTFNEISEYINNPFLKDLCNFIESNYNVEARIEHSSCSLLPGWNVKYKKSGKSICTLYPNKNYFTCMLTVSSKNQEEIEYFLPSCTEYIQNIYKNTTIFNNSRWLMFDITSTEILKDVKELISIKVKD